MANTAMIISKSEELVEISDALNRLIYKNRKIKGKCKNLEVHIGSTWSYNENTDYTCTIFEVHEGCLGVKMCSMWSGKPYNDIMNISFFEGNFTEVIMFSRLC